MNKLRLNRNGNDVDVIEVGDISNKEQLIFGNYDRDVILRTKGTIMIQVQNKFFDLLSPSVSNLPQNTSIIFTDDITLNETFTEGTLIIDRKTKSLYVYDNDTLTNIITGESGQTPLLDFISYGANQSLNADEKERALYNIGYNWNPSIVSDFKSNQVIFNTSTLTHQVFNDGSLSDIYLSLINGGIVQGHSSFRKGLCINSLNEMFVTPETKDFSGLIISKDDTLSGLVMYAGEHNNYIQNLSGRSLIIRMSNTFDNGYNDILSITENEVKLVQTVNSGYLLNVAGSVFTESIVTSLGINSDNYDKNTPVYDKLTGFIINETNLTEDILGWELEIDRVYEKLPNSKSGLSSINRHSYLQKPYFIKQFDQNVLELQNDSGLIAGDILVGALYDWNNEITNYIHVVLKNKLIEDNETIPNSWEVTLINEYSSKPFMSLIKVGNINTTSKNVLLDSNANNIKIVANVNNVNLLYPNGIPNIDTDEDVPKNEKAFIVYPNQNIEAALGSLREIVDVDFGLNKNEIHGLYATSSFIKGKAILDYLKLGDKLLYENGQLKLSPNILQITDTNDIQKIKGASYVNNIATVNLNLMTGSIYREGNSVYIVVAPNTVKLF